MRDDITSDSDVGLASPLLDDPIAESRRQIEICNACRYCEGYCDVFPAITLKRDFTDGDIVQLANLCHNCRGCYYACQYTEPHEFAINLPRALAATRTDSWERFARPRALGAVFHRHGAAVAAALVLGFALIFELMALLRPVSGAGFYAYLSHGAMVAIFAPAFLLPLYSIAQGLRAYWAEVDGERVTAAHLRHALGRVATLRNLSGGQGQGCNFEKGDRFSVARKHYHQAALWGFALCFASTSSGTILHYGFDAPAPHRLLSIPKLFGLPGGILLCMGTYGLAKLKLKAPRGLGDGRVWGADLAFIGLLFLTGLSGLLLYAATGTALVPTLLALHLGAVLAFFLLTPYSKMAHGFYRLAALVRDAQTRAPR
jgi:citrate/tricarballylate utilization protein